MYIHMSRTLKMLKQMNFIFIYLAISTLKKTSDTI